MKKLIELQIPLGYTLEDKVESMDIRQAEQYLLSRRVRRYTSAVRHDLNAQLYSRWLVCPCCGKRFVANAHSYVFSNAEHAMFLPPDRPGKEQIERWASLQMTLFNPNEHDELLISPPMEAPGRFLCPNCDNESYETAAKRQVVLRLNRNKLSVKSEIIQIDEVLCLEWIRAKDLRLSFPIYEVLTFDLGKGRAHVKIENAQGDVLCQRDVSAYPEKLEGGAAYKVLMRNKVVLRNVRSLFREAWGQTLPYSWKQTDMTALFEMTRFVGYPRRFYDSIPYVQHSFRIDRGFGNRAKRMHFAKDLVELYREAKLPTAKSIRRILFSEPGLFFYLHEIKDLWEAIKDTNLLSRFLTGGRVYEILSAIHMRPGIMEYIRDFCERKDPVYLLSDMHGDWGTLQRRAIDYCCMSPRLRLKAQQSWGSRRGRRGERTEVAYSMPMCRPDERIVDCIIDGYSFVWLRSSNDYAIAAGQLVNCLDEWQPTDSPVVAVRRRGRYLAAIEVSDRHVIQARGYDNGPIDSNPALYEAFCKWMARNGLEWEQEEPEEQDGFGFDEPEELPF